ncbi:mitochondrial GTPase 1 [Megachile rotundata]|uniref:mitochondrial GTPase 1 n=1 Tax=Megachile rotundata TaxID=143995 RepID=UPI000258DEF1|nr:PREDICTED: mitochondrial GTPase 1 isoform X1 [Megachile rotundata]XP_012137634.1 PREDICTED: mitochondrial GTPase 1 isoform X1 [Megachile rotundata]
MANLGGNVLPKFRDKFKVTTKDILRWFPGHMQKGIRQMERQLKNVDCIIEVHDARVPISGHYADFKKTLTGIKPHIFLLSKMDLADMTLKKSIIQNLSQENLSNVVFSNLKDMNCKGVKNLLPLAQKLIKESNRFNRAQETSYQIMIIGVPNVGKSSLINRLRNVNLRKTNAAHVGGVAGITRSVSTRIQISEDPKIYVLDTPGILTPKLNDVDTGLKLALVGCMQDHLVGPEVLADYLLFWLNKNGKFEYVEKLGLTEPNDDILYVLTYTAAKIKKTIRIKNYDGRIIMKPDIRFAAEHIVSRFRKGELGYYCLDEDILK